MSKFDKDLQRQIALFRYGVIADLVHLPRGHLGIGARIKAKAALTYSIPGTDRDRIAVNTMRGWLSRYRTGGVVGQIIPLTHRAFWSDYFPGETCDVVD